jgi:hypothetical protein
LKPLPICNFLKWCRDGFSSNVIQDVEYYW